MRYRVIIKSSCIVINYLNSTQGFALSNVAVKKGLETTKQCHLVCSVSHPVVVESGVRTEIFKSVNYSLRGLRPGQIYRLLYILGPAELIGTRSFSEPTKPWPKRTELEKCLRKRLIEILRHSFYYSPLIAKAMKDDWSVSNCTEIWAHNDYGRSPPPNNKRKMF